MTRVMYDVSDWEGISAIRARRDEETCQVYLSVIYDYGSGIPVDVLVLSTGMEITILGRDPSSCVVPITFEVRLDVGKIHFRSINNRFNCAGTMKVGKTYEMVDFPHLDEYEANWDDDVVVPDPFHTNS